MPSFVLGILLFAASGHAVWNAVSRKIPERDNFFTLILLIAVILYFPLAVYLMLHNKIPTEAWGWMAASTVFEILYFMALAKAYREGEFLTVYPVARGAAPLLTTLISLFLTRPLIHASGFAGILCVTGGIIFINQTKLSFREARKMLIIPATRWALLTGFFTASYTVCDSMGSNLMSPILFKYLVFVGLALGKWLIDLKLVPGVQLFSLFNKYPGKSLLGGFLVFGVNALVVSVMPFAPVAFISATREMSILFGAMIGIMVLKERLTLVKACSIAAIVTGVILIKLG